MHEPDNPKYKQVCPGTSSPRVHAVGQSQSLHKTEADHTVTNFRIPFQCTMYNAYVVPRTSEIPLNKDRK